MILYVSVLRRHAFIINSVQIRFIVRVGLFNALPWSSARMSSCLQISIVPKACIMESRGGGRGGVGVGEGNIGQGECALCVPLYPLQSHVWLILLLRVAQQLLPVLCKLPSRGVPGICY